MVLPLNPTLPSYEQLYQNLPLVYLRRPGRLPFRLRHGGNFRRGAETASPVALHRVRTRPDGFHRPHRHGDRGLVRRPASGQIWAQVQSAHRGGVVFGVGPRFRTGDGLGNVPGFSLYWWGGRGYFFGGGANVHFRNCAAFAARALSRFVSVQYRAGHLDFLPLQLRPGRHRRKRLALDAGRGGHSGGVVYGVHFLYSGKSALADFEKKQNPRSARNPQRERLRGSRTRGGGRAEKQASIY